jgi:hypothetical protein
VKSDNGMFILKTDYIIIDCICVLLAVVLFIVQAAMESAGTINYMQISILMISRAYMKFPITFVLIRFIIMVNRIKNQMRAVHPQREELTFRTYKQKVLFIINSVRSQFSRRIMDNQPNQDLKWCAYIIENDYLQISNSISSDAKLKYKSDDCKKRRRFSKTVQGKNSDKVVENPILKKLSTMALNLVEGTYKDTEKPFLESYATHFLDRKYDAFLADQQVSGNLLYFTLVYNMYKFDWKKSIPTLDENLFKKMAHRLQGSYRANFYHT